MNETSNIGSRARLKNVSSIGRMKHGGKHRCLAGIVAVAAMSAACTASPPSASAPAAPGSAATRVALAAVRMPVGYVPRPTGTVGCGRRDEEASLRRGNSLRGGGPQLAEPMSLFTASRPPVSAAMSTA